MMTAVLSKQPPARMVTPGDTRVVPSIATGLQSRPILIQGVEPCVDDGRYPIKREVGDDVEVRATIFRDGHDKLAAVALYRREDETEWRQAPLTLLNPGLDLWSGRFRLSDNTTYVYTVEAWTDVYESWCGELEKKLADGQMVTTELIEGRLLVEHAMVRAAGDDLARMQQAVAACMGHDDDVRASVLLDAGLRLAMARCADRSLAIRYDRELTVTVDRVAARFSAWYEMFHRSQGRIPGKSATFADCEERLPEIRSMGFDVIYLVPIHPSTLR